jgi:hypothetical protein
MLIQTEKLTVDQFKRATRLCISNIATNIAALEAYREDFNKRWREFNPLSRDLAFEVAFGMSSHQFSKRLAYLRGKLDYPESGIMQTEELDKENTSTQIQKLHNPIHATPPDRPEAPVNPPKPAPKATFCAADFPEEEEDKASVTAAPEPATVEVEAKCPQCKGTGKITKTVRAELTDNEHHTLFKAGVPESDKLTVQYARYVIGRLAKNDWTLPKDLFFLKNRGEYEERKFKGAP